MASVSISHLVLFIASLLIAASVAGTMVTGVDRVSDAMGDHSLDASETIETDLTIISDTGSEAIYDADEAEIELLLKNTGSTTLGVEPTDFDVLVNGQYVHPAQIEITPLPADSNRSDWPASTVIAMTIAFELDPGDHRVSVQTRGKEDLVRFRVS